MIVRRLGRQSHLMSQRLKSSRDRVSMGTDNYLCSGTDDVQYKDTGDKSALCPSLGTCSFLFGEDFESLGRGNKGRMFGEVGRQTCRASMSKQVFIAVIGMDL